MRKNNLKSLDGTKFQKAVWAEIQKIPKGKTCSYKELATKIGKKNAVRAVANAVGANPLIGSIPCHRVVRSDGTIGGYSGKGGVRAKRKMLQNEGVRLT